MPGDPVVETEGEESQDWGSWGGESEPEAPDHPEGPAAADEGIQPNVAGTEEDGDWGAWGENDPEVPELPAEHLGQYSMAGNADPQEPAEDQPHGAHSEGGAVHVDQPEDAEAASNAPSDGGAWGNWGSDEEDPELPNDPQAEPENVDGDGQQQGLPQEEAAQREDAEPHDLREESDSQTAGGTGDFQLSPPRPLTPAEWELFSEHKGGTTKWCHLHPDPAGQTGWREREHSQCPVPRLAFNVSFLAFRLVGGALRVCLCV